MILVGGLSLPLSYTENELKRAAAKRLSVASDQIETCRLFRRSVDARRRDAVHFEITAAVTAQDEAALLARCRDPRIKAYQPTVLTVPKIPARTVRPVVVGAGPAGLFAAMVLAKAGCCPLLLERGRPVEQRAADVEHFRKTGVLDTVSNVQFGEGGAGTFSDGKLNTGIKDPRCRWVLETLVEAGAPEEILWQAKPHVGTDRLQQTVAGLRKRLLSLGAAVRFETQVTGVMTERGHLTALSVTTPAGKEIIPCDAAIFAIGHSARDTVEMLYNAGVRMERKPFAVGVRIEHRREDIDRALYGKFAAHPAIGAADYKLVCHLPGGRGVYTFCMCPGGEVIAAASEAGGVAVNGMSVFARNGDNSNSALLCGVEPTDIAGTSPLDSLRWQREWEQKAFALGGGDYRAPVQLAGDFLQGCRSSAPGTVEPSYRPGVTFTDLSGCLPPFVAASLKQALPQFDRRITGFAARDAVLTGIESRSSSPVRLLRDEQGRSSIAGIFPCGEGAGYAGGITSAAVDGIRCALWIIENYKE